MALPKISLVGAGQIGGTMALLASLSKLGQVQVIDIAGDMAKGKALDLDQAGAVLGFEGNLRGGESYADLKGSDVVIVTAGIPRKPGMSRDDLLEINAKVIAGVGREIKAHAPDAFVIVVTNPLDAMVWVMQQASGLPAQKVVGMAGILDSSRFRFFLSEALGVSMKDIHTMVLGGHGDAMVPLLKFTTVNGIPLQHFIDQGHLSSADLDAMVERTRKGGGEIVSLLKNGSAFYAPAASALEMAQAYLYDEKRLLPCAALCQGEYGVKDIYVGVPVVLGKTGVEKIVELPLDKAEKEAFATSVAGVEGLVQSVSQYL